MFFRTTLVNLFLIQYIHTNKMSIWPHSNTTMRETAYSSKLVIHKFVKIIIVV